MEGKLNENRRAVASIYGVIKVLILMCILFSVVSCQKTTVIYMVGDSTMANKPIDYKPEHGWGQLLPEFFTEAVFIDNHAKNGRSTRSFIYEGRWDSVLTLLKKGDYIVIQFGHNDGSEYKTERYCTPVEYRYNMTKMIRESRWRGANPILCTSIQRRKFDSTGNLVDTHGVYPIITRELAEQYNVPLIDMQKRSNDLIMSYGVEDSKSLFLHIKAGEYERFPEGKVDNTHFSETGARLMASLFVDGIMEMNHELKNYLKTETNE